MKIEKIRHECSLAELHDGDCFVYEERLYLLLDYNKNTMKYNVVNFNDNYVRFFDNPETKVHKVSAKIVIND